MKKHFKFSVIVGWLVVLAAFFFVVTKSNSQTAAQNCGINFAGEKVYFTTAHGVFSASIDADMVCLLTFYANSVHCDSDTIKVRTHFFCSKNEDVKQRVGKTVWLTKLGECRTYEGFLMESGMESGIHSREAYAHAKKLSWFMLQRFPACCISELQQKICVAK